MRKKRKKTKHLGPLPYLKAPGPALVVTEERCEYRPYDEASPCDACPDADKHCYECAHEHRRMDGQGWVIPAWVREDEIWGS